MNDFLEIFTHGRKLQGAVKSLSTDELMSVAHKLNKIIENRRIKELEEENKQKEKLQKINAIQDQLREAGLDINDLKPLIESGKSSRSGQKRPVKYILKDEKGKEHPWTGIGRMPKVYVKALADGKNLEEFKV